MKTQKTDMFMKQNNYILIFQNKLRVNPLQWQEG